MVETAFEPCSRRSQTWAFNIDLTSTVSPAAAVPVRMKIPEPITAPIPNAVRLHGPRVDQRVDALGTKELVHLALPLALHHLFDFFLHRAASHTRGPFGLGGSFLAGGALQRLAFGFICNGFRIHQLKFSSIPRIVPPASSIRDQEIGPSVPCRDPVLGGGGAFGSGPGEVAARGAIGVLNRETGGLAGGGGPAVRGGPCAGTCMPGREAAAEPACAVAGRGIPGGCMPRSEKNCEMLSSEL